MKNASPFDAIGGPGRGCRLCVVIPARNEAEYIGAALAAFARQRQPDGASLPSGVFEILIFANACSDATAAIARQFAARHPDIPTHVAELGHTADVPHVGAARALALGFATNRFLDALLPEGLVASTDADTIVADDWVAQTLAEAEDADAVAGHVTLDAAAQNGLLAPVRLLYLRELAYRRALAETESLLDPLPADPAPRHASFVGASFAVRARTYRAAGGLPPLARLEDLAFSRSLGRIDARVRHSLLVRAFASARRFASVDGGFGSFVSELHERALRGETYEVEDPARTLEDIACRAALRRMWRGRICPQDRSLVNDTLRLESCAWEPLVDPALAFGAVYERILFLAEPGRRFYAPTSVERAISVLRAIAEQNAAAPTRASAASGAG